MSVMTRGCFSKGDGRARACPISTTSSALNPGAATRSPSDRRPSAPELPGVTAILCGAATPPRCARRSSMAASAWRKKAGPSSTAQHRRRSRPPRRRRRWSAAGRARRGAPCLGVTSIFRSPVRSAGGRAPVDSQCRPSPLDSTALTSVVWADGSLSPQYKRDLFVSHPAAKRLDREKMDRRRPPRVARRKAGREDRRGTEPGLRHPCASTKNQYAERDEANRPLHRQLPPPYRAAT